MLTDCPLNCRPRVPFLVHERFRLSVELNPERMAEGKANVLATPPSSLLEGITVMSHGM